MTQSRRPSPLQRRVLIVLATLDEKAQGHVLTRDIERVLEQSGEAPSQANLRASCRRLEDAGWLAAYPARPESAAGSGADGCQGHSTPSFARRRNRLRVLVSRFKRYDNILLFINC